MKVIKSRTEIALIRLLERCQEMAKNSEDIASEWRLPEFVASCEQMLTSLPKAPDSCATSPDSVLEYQNKIKFLKSLLPPPEEEKYETDQRPAQQIVPMPLPQGSSLARDTVSKQIYQKMAERQNLSSRDQLLGQTSNREPEGVKGGMTLDKLMADQREQQERIAEEMIMLTRSLGEQSRIAGNIIRSDTAKLESASAMADSNLEKLDVETKRVGEFSARGNCRCWIWLMMVIVVFTFIGMVLMMRLFSKKIQVPTATPTVETVSKTHTHIVEEL